jgi:hypothetical protein
MASVPTLDQPPTQPPDVTGQQGQSPYSGMSSMLQDKLGGQQQGGPGQVNPKGALLNMSEAVKKVLDQMAKMESGFGPFADRIRALLDAGIGAINAGGPGGAQNPGQISGPASAKPDQGDNGAAFPG